MITVIRTQVSLEQTDYKLAKKEARALGISFAELVRRVVRQSLPNQQEPAAGPPQARWMHYAGFVDSRDPNSSHTIDKIVYGQKP